MLDLFRNSNELGFEFFFRWLKDRLVGNIDSYDPQVDLSTSGKIISNTSHYNFKRGLMYFELHAFVDGEVQGVGFRATTHHYAKQLNLSGSAKNLKNGQVEIIARGTKENLEDLLSKLKNTFGVTSITVDYTPCETNEGSFQIE